MNTKTFCFILLMGSIVGGCKKEIKGKDLNGTKWKIVSMKSSAGTELWYYPAKLSCELDNIYEFHESGQLNLYDAGEICNPAQNSSTTWTIDNGRLYVGGTANIQGGQHVIDRLNDNELVVTHTYSQRVTTYQRQ